VGHFEPGASPTVSFLVHIGILSIWSTGHEEDIVIRLIKSVSQKVIAIPTKSRKVRRNMRLCVL